MTVKTKTQTRKELQKVINELVSLPCVFWACPGPNAPTQGMATCKLCYAVKDLRRIRKEL